MGELVLSNVTKTYVAARGQQRRVLDGISLTVASGDFVVLVGPSGCGKSTLLRIIAGLMVPDPVGATLTIDGESIEGPGPDRGVVFQQYHYYPWLTVLENIEFGLRFLSISARERTTRAEAQLDLVGLTDYRDEYPAVLSGGQQQRVAIARALVSGPKVILMDEPFAALDAQTREAMQTELLQLQRRTGSTIVFVTHDIAEAAFLGNQVYVLTRIPSRISACIDARATRDEIFGARTASAPDSPDARLGAGADDLRYDARFLAIQRQLKLALDAQVLEEDGRVLPAVAGAISGRVDATAIDARPR